MKCLFRTYLLVLTYIASQDLTAQDAFGNITSQEKAMTAYSKAPDAPGVYLSETGNNYFKVIHNRIYLVKEYHAKIKVFKATSFENGTVDIMLYHKGQNIERIDKLEAATFVDGQAIYVPKKDRYTTDVNERWRKLSFTFPKIKDGAILEYRYTLVSPYAFNFNGWEFQANIPKLSSEFNAEIPGNWTYNRNLRGNLPLAVNKSSLKKHCFRIDGVPGEADCEMLRYIMKDIPAFKEDDNYALAPSNYRSAITFELSEYRDIKGNVTKYTKSWEDVDRDFKTDRDLGRQLRKKNFFERNVPNELLENGSPMERAQNIYRFVQDHFTWNETYSDWGKARVKDAFDSKKGMPGKSI